LLHNIRHILEEKGSKKNKNYMKEQFGEMVKIVKIHHLHKDGEDEMKLLQVCINSARKQQ
jgi:hypothetical protein